MGKAVMKGRNPKYPPSIEYWKLGIRPVPEWLSDKAKVKGMEGDSVILDLRYGTNGGYEIIGSDGLGVLIKTGSREDLICFGEDKLFTLRPLQFEILYQETVE